ncbi:MAG TPA: hypothetical protein VNW97_05570 [Candidatus Saccharimonadales bacterium]|jgi:hypothetical protein|nr:hypothetical protein [Candidatus Saccharimonadales bacterium]
MQVLKLIFGFFPAKLKREKPMTCLKCQHSTVKKFGRYGSPAHPALPLYFLLHDLF